MLKKVMMTILTLLIIMHLFLILTTSFYTIEENENAVVEFRGKIIEVVKEPGFKFKIPYPYATLKKVNTQTFSMKFGYEEDRKGMEISNSDAKMITGDENIVLVDLVVQYKVVDIEKYLYKNEDPQETLYNATSASIRSVIGSSKIDSALTDGKAEIEAKTKEKLINYIDKLDIGISVSAVKLQDVDLPNEEVRKAFTSVTDARENMNTKLNEADKYNNKITNEVEGKIKSILNEAESEKEQRIQNALGDVSIFNSLYSEYAKNKNLTKDRLILETMDEVLKDANIYIMNSDGTNTYLPLNEIKNKKEGEK